jgi:DNA-binding transcriptional LysR family regulator
VNDWDGYRVFAAVVERGSFSRAAGELGISQPTASRRVDELERSLGARLLVRRARGVVPTPAGERVAAEVRRMAQAAVLAGAAATGAAGPARRRVRISATEGFGAVWLPHRIAELRAGHPELAIEIVVDNAASDLGARQADLAVRLFRPRQADLVARRVGSVGFGLFAAQRYLAARGAPRRLDDLAKHDHVGFIDRGALAPSYLRWLRKIVPEDRFVASASSLLAMTELARAGTGIVLGTVALLAADPRLVRILPRARPPAMDIWLAVHADVRRDPDVVLVMDRLAAVFAREAAALSDA